MASTIHMTAKVDMRPMEKDLARAIGRVQNQLNRKMSFELDEKGFTQPLGRITGNMDEFEKSLKASNARVLAFAASAGILYKVSQAFSHTVKSMANVESKLADINVIMNLSTKNLQKMGAGLFDIARKTGQSFDAVAQSMTEFSRQGLGMQESLRRTTDALVLARLAGMDTIDATNSLTAAINSFSKAGLTTTAIVNKLAKVDAAFAVSSEDLANALKRVGGSAQAAGVTFDQLLAVTTTLQERTARGGAVIGNSLKTIFTRIQRPDVLKQLDRMGIAVTTLRGEMLPTMTVLKNMARAFDGLAVSQKSQVSEMVGGVFQVSMLKSLMADLGQGVTVYDKALRLSNTATNEATVRNKALNETLSARVNALQQISTKFAAQVGDLALRPTGESIVGKLDALMGGLSKNLEQEGFSLGRALLTGLGDFISGPGLMIVGVALGKIISQYAVDVGKSLQTIIKMGGKRAHQVELEHQITNQYTKQLGLVDQVARGVMTEEKAHGRILTHLREQLALTTQISNMGISGAGSMARAGTLVYRGGKWLPKPPGKFAGHIPSFSGGHIPDSVRKDEIMGALASGYIPGKVKTANISGIGKVAYNSAEKIKKFPGLSQPAIMPPRHSDAGRTYSGKFKKIHGFTPYAGGGIPDLGIDPSSGTGGFMAALRAEMARNVGSTMDPSNPGFGRVVGTTGSVSGLAGVNKKFTTAMTQFSDKLLKVPVDEMAKVTKAHVENLKGMGAKYKIHGSQMKTMTESSRALGSQQEVLRRAKEAELAASKKAAKDQKRTTAAMGIAIMAPMIGGMLKEGFDMGRKGSSVTDAASGTLSMAATGFMIGGPKGAVIGAGLGAFTGVGKIIDAFTNELPDFQANLKAAVAELQKFDDSMGTFTKSMGDYRDFLTGKKGAKGDSPQIREQNARQAAEARMKGEVGLVAAGFTPAENALMLQYAQQGDTAKMDALRDKKRKQMSDKVTPQTMGTSLKAMITEFKKKTPKERGESQRELAELLLGFQGSKGPSLLTRLIESPKLGKQLQLRLNPLLDVDAVDPLSRLMADEDVGGAAKWAASPFQFMDKTANALGINKLWGESGEGDPVAMWQKTHIDPLIEQLMPGDPAKGGSPEMALAREALLKAISTSTDAFDAQSAGIQGSIVGTITEILKMAEAVRAARKKGDFARGLNMPINEFRKRMAAINDGLRRFDAHMEEMNRATKIGTANFMSVFSTRAASKKASASASPLSQARYDYDVQMQAAEFKRQATAFNAVSAIRDAYKGVGLKEIPAAMQEVGLPLGTKYRPGGPNTQQVQGMQAQELMMKRLEGSLGEQARMGIAISGIGLGAAETPLERGTRGAGPSVSGRTLPGVRLKALSEISDSALKLLSTDSKLAEGREKALLNIEGTFRDFDSKMITAGDQARADIILAGQKFVSAMDKVHHELLIGFGGGIKSIMGPSAAAQSMKFHGNRLTAASETRPARFRGKAALENLEAMKQFGLAAGFSMADYKTFAGPEMGAIKQGLVAQYQGRAAGMGLNIPREQIGKAADKQIQAALQPVQKMQLPIMGSMNDHLAIIRKDGVKIKNPEDIAKSLDDIFKKRLAGLKGGASPKYKGEFIDPASLVAPTMAGKSEEEFKKQWEEWLGNVASSADRKKGGQPANVLHEIGRFKNMKAVEEAARKPASLEASLGAPKMAGAGGATTQAIWNQLYPDIEKAGQAPMGATKVAPKPRMGKAMWEGFFHNENDFNTQVGRVKETFVELSTELRGGFKGALKEAMFSAESLSDALRSAAVNILDSISGKIFDLSFDAMFNAFGDKFGPKAKGGYVRGYAGGGLVRGGTGFRDDVPAMLSQGEFVIRRSAVDKYGSGPLSALNMPTGGGVSISAKNTLIPNDPKRPTSFKYDIDSRLSALAVTDENRPDVKRRKEIAEKIFRNNVQYEMAKKAWKAQQQGRLIQAYTSAAMMFAAHGMSGGSWKTANRGFGSGPAGAAKLKAFKFEKAIGSDFGQGGGGFKDWPGGNRGGFIGGPARGYASGGYVDNVPAMLMGGEFVVNRGAVNKHGRGFFEKLNRSHFQEGGYVGGGFEETSGSTGAVDVFDRLIESNDALKTSIDESKFGKSNTNAGSETAAVGQGATNTFNINVTVDKSGGVNTETQANSVPSGNKEQDAEDERKANELSESIRTTCLDVILNEKRPGGALSEDSATRQTAY